MARSLAEDIAIQASKLPWGVCWILAYISYLVLDHFAINPNAQPDMTGFDVGTMGSFAVKYLHGYIAYFAKFLFPFIFIFAGIGSLLRSKKISPFGRFAIITATVIIGLAIYQAFYNKLTEPINSVSNNNKNVGREAGLETSKQIPISKERAQAISQHNEEQAGKRNRIEKGSPTRYTMYSWKEENGYRGYSNTSFPTDRPYSDPKIEFR